MNEEEHAKVQNLLSGQVTDAGAVMHFALCLCPSSCCWEVSGSLCVLVLCSGQGGKGRVGSELGPWMTQMSEMVKHTSRFVNQCFALY